MKTVEMEHVSKEIHLASSHGTIQDNEREMSSWSDGTLHRKPPRTSSNRHHTLLLSRQMQCQLDICMSLQWISRGHYGRIHIDITNLPWIRSAWHSLTSQNCPCKKQAPPLCVVVLPHTMSFDHVVVTNRSKWGNLPMPSRILRKSYRVCQRVSTDWLESLTRELAHEKNLMIYKNWLTLGNFFFCILLF